MIEAVRNLSRRKLRTGLTIFGITIGIFALSVMGSLSEFLSTTVDSGIKYTGDFVRVLPKGGYLGTGVIDESLGKDLEALPNVKRVSGGMVTQAEESVTAPVGLLNTKFILGLDPVAVNDIFGNIPLSEGRLLREGDKTEVVIGQSIAATGLKVGDQQEFRGFNATVVGIFQPTQNPQIDSFIIAPLSSVQEVNSTPGVVNFFIVVPDDPANADKVADNINETYPKKFQALNPTELKDQVRQGVLIFNIIILAGAALAAVVGGFATINTMIMSVSERTREIGIKKAVGASEAQIVKEFLTESALMGFLGGVIGVTLAKVATIGINYYTKTNASGLEVFSLTPRLALSALTFAVILGSIAGLLPALKAARLNIVKALSEE